MGPHQGGTVGKRLRQVAGARQAPQVELEVKAGLAGDLEGHP